MSGANEEAKRKVHLCIEAMARTLHDAVEATQSDLALLLVTQLIAGLAVDLEARTENPSRNAEDAKRAIDRGLLQ